MNKQTINRSLSAEEIRQLIFQQFTEPLNKKELQQTIIKWVVDMLEADAGELYLWDSEDQVLVLTFPTGHKKEYLERYEGSRLQSGEGLAGRVFKTLQPMFIHNYGDWEGQPQMFKDYGYTEKYHILAVPMMWQEKAIGVLTIDSENENRPFTENDLRIAQHFANMSAVSIMNAKLYEILQVQTVAIQNALQQEVIARTAELEAYMKQLNLSVKIGREITSILDVDILLEQVVNLIHQTFGYYSVLIFLLDSPKSEISLQAASGKNYKALLKKGLNFPLNASSLNGEAIINNEINVVNDIHTAKNFQYEPLLSETVSEICVPLIVGDEKIGSIDIQSNKTAPFSEQELLILQSLGDQVAIAIHNARLYEQSKDIAVIEERNRLARELHDSVSQSLFSMDLQARAIETWVNKDVEKAITQIQELRQTTHNTLQEMRSLIYELRPIPLKEIGLNHALQEQLYRMQKENRFEIEFSSNLDKRLPDNVEICIFRIAQEAVNNASKHAAASRIECRLMIESNRVQLSVQDNGRGFDVDKARKNKQTFGLLGMKERTNLIKGSFQVKSRPGEGTKIIVSIPL